MAVFGSSESQPFDTAIRIRLNHTLLEPFCKVSLEEVLMRKLQLLRKHLRLHKQATDFLGAECTGLINSTEASSSKKAAAIPSWQADSFHTCSIAKSSSRSSSRRAPPGNALAEQPSSQERESTNQVISNEPNETWTAVLDKQTGGVYFWNKNSGETTAVGEPKPGPMGRQAFQTVGQPVTFGRAMISMVAMGAGVGLMFGIIGRIF